MAEPKITIIDINQLLGILIEAPESGPICDFCSDTPVVGTHICEPSVAGKDTAILSEDVDGLWAACATCDAFIAAENWAGLLEHSMKRLAESLAVYGLASVPNVMRQDVQASHKRFISTRKLAN